MTYPDLMMAAAQSGGQGGGGGGGRGGSWEHERGEFKFRMEQAEEEAARLREEISEMKETAAELRTSTLTKLTAIDGKLDFLGFKAGLWAALANSIGILIGVAMLYWKLSK